MRFLAGLLFLAALSCFGSPATGQLPDNPPPADQNRNAGSYLGVGVRDLDSGRVRSLNADTDTGVEVVRLTAGSPADKAGLRAGDVLLTYNGENILGGLHLGRLVSETPAGRHVKVKYWRDGNVQTCVVTTAAPPATASNDLQSRVREFNEQLGRLHFSMPMDIPTPLLMWRNRFLGIICEPLDAQLADYFGVKEGVLVRFVEKGSPAETAGIRSGDVLTSIGSQPLINPRDVTICIRSQTVSNQVTISLMRNRKPLKLNVTPAEYPQ